MDDVNRKIEDYLKTFHQIELFETIIDNPEQSVITIYFKKEYENNNFPYRLKSYLEDKVTSIGGVDWSISGVGRGFSNSVTKTRKGNQIVLEGYNYEMLYYYAKSLQKQLIENSKGRVKEVEITYDLWKGNPRDEYNLEFNDEKLALYENSQMEIYEVLKNKLSSINLKTIIYNNQIQDIKVISDKYETIDVWNIENTPISLDKNQIKLSDLALIKRERTGNLIRKINQEYRLLVVFDYIGSAVAGEKYTEKK